MTEATLKDGDQDWPETLSEFKEGQWWVQELDNMKESQGTTLDQKRAVSVVHHLLASVALHLAQESAQ